MLKRIVKWLPIVNLFILAGLILDVFCFKSFSLWWLWLALSTVFSIAYGKYVNDKAKEEAKEHAEWQEEVDSIRETFVDLDRRSSIHPSR